MREWACRLWWIVLLWGAAGSVHAQPVPLRFTGRVITASEGDPLPGAHVFIAGSTIGTAADVSGRFSLTVDHPGPVDLVVSMVGFERQQVRLESSDSDLTFRLVAVPLALENVDVAGEVDRAWRKHLRRFETLFFGTTRNAGACTLLNPEVLDLRLDSATGMLVAEAEEPLVFVNRALGYRVEYTLDRFSGNETMVQWGGISRFTALEPRDAREQRRFERERKRAYFGSSRHFLAALYADTVLTAGFSVYAVPEPGVRSGRAPLPPEAWQTLLRPTGQPGRSYLDFDGALLVTFGHEIEEARYRTVNPSRGPNAYQVSWLKLRLGPVAMDSTGHVLDTYELLHYGYWAWERAAELLPWDYAPGSLVP